MYARFDHVANELSVKTTQIHRVFRNAAGDDMQVRIRADEYTFVATRVHSSQQDKT